ncbi:uncharacterized protein LOC108086485 [Drosophila ficusphila]|uniref:uncharacterized protein LOC108086485 n=1 Tax=Drosophila ficusphila TaxID=30025 RepID=UPI0007E874D2|nr:uncharacterized protein LOC108086485 [Drosophila ficusphila]
MDSRIFVLDQLSRVPIRCPVGSCPATLSTLDLLIHLKDQHWSPSTLERHLQVAYEGERCILSFDHLKLPPRTTICLGVILFAGKRGIGERLPGERGLCHRNRLPSNLGWEPLEDHLPIMVLARRCAFFEWLTQDKRSKSGDEIPGHWYYQFRDHADQSRQRRKEELQKEEASCHSHFNTGEPSKPTRENQANGSGSQDHQEPRNQFVDLGGKDSQDRKSKERKDEGQKDLDMYLIWTQSVPCTKPLYFSITAYDRIMSEGRSALRLVANSGMIRPEVDGKQLPKARNSLWLNQQEVEDLSGTERILRLEMILQEDLESV